MIVMIMIMMIIINDADSNTIIMMIMIKIMILNNNHDAFQLMMSYVCVTPRAKGADLQGLVWPAQVLQIQGQPRPPFPSAPQAAHPACHAPQFTSQEPMHPQKVCQVQ